MFAKKLKALRQEKGLSQNDLAKMLYVSQQTVGSWETGRTTPNPETLSKIVSILGVSADDLLGNEQKEKPAIKKDDEPHKIPGYDQLTPANKAAIDQLIANLLKSQSDG